MWMTVPISPMVPAGWFLCTVVSCWTHIFSFVRFGRVVTSVFLLVNRFVLIFRICWRCLCLLLIAISVFDGALLNVFVALSSKVGMVYFGLNVQKVVHTFVVLNKDLLPSLFDFPQLQCFFVLFCLGGLFFLFFFVLYCKKVIQISEKCVAVMKINIIRSFSKI